MFNKYTWKSCLVYLGNITIFSKNNDQYHEYIEHVLSALYAAGASMNLKKCHSFTTKTEFLGHTITPHKPSITKARSKDFKDTGHPRALTKLRSFLGMCNVYCRFVSTYSRVAAQINDLLKKGQPTNFPSLDDDHSRAFKNAS